VRHRPYRLPLPAFAAPAAAHLPVGIESSRSARALGTSGAITLPSSGRAPISAQLIEAAGAVAEALRWCAHPVEHRQE